jgi:hypothetical protein
MTFAANATCDGMGIELPSIGYVSPLRFVSPQLSLFLFSISYPGDFLIELEETEGIV